MRAQNDALRPASALVFGLGAGAFKFEPVSALYLARPLAVNPAPWEAGNFSPRPTDNDTEFLAILLTVDDCIVNHNRLRQRAAANVTQRDRGCSRTHARYPSVVRAGCAVGDV